MRDIKKSKIDLRGFYELVRAAERQGLTALFTDSDTCDTIVDMWPGEAEELEDGVPVVLFDTHYSDKTGPSNSNELLDMGTLDMPKCGDIVAEHANGKIVAVSIDCGSGLGEARVTFAYSTRAGVEPPDDVSGNLSKGEEAALDILDGVSDSAYGSLERINDEAIDAIASDPCCKEMNQEDVDDIVYLWMAALSRGGLPCWREEYRKLKRKQ